MALTTECLVCGERSVMAVGAGRVCEDCTRAAVCAWAREYARRRGAPPPPTPTSPPAGALPVVKAA